MADSYQKITLRSKIGPLSIELTSVGPPTVNPDRIAALARLQVVGLMYWLTYDETTQQGGFVSGDFGMIDTVMRQDWGNPRQVHFMEKTADWEPRLVGQTASEHFRVAIRKSPAERHWSWALEWNKNFRTVGLLGEPEAINRFVSDLPFLGFREVKNRDGEILRKRDEVSLAPEFDTLFTSAEDSCDSA